MAKIHPILINSQEEVHFYELRQTLDPNYPPHVLSMGGGYDSIALFLEYCLNPDSRNFPLSNLVVIHSVVGGEAAELKRLIETVIFPLARRLNIWWIQAHRNGDSQKDGITILSSTRQPTKFYLKGSYELLTHLVMSGTVPQRGGGKRLCTLKFKGWVIDTIAQALFQDTNPERLVGFNADETSRLDKSYASQPYEYEIGFNSDEAGRIKESADRKQVFRFPLIEMGHGRQWCEDRVDRYVAEVTHGLITRWRKSYCTNVCPFPECNGKRKKGNNTHGDLRQDWLNEPIRGGEAEHIALAINENQPLYTKQLVIEILRETGNQAAIAHYNALLVGDWADKVIASLEQMHTSSAIAQADGVKQGRTWAVYCVRRMFLKEAMPYRQTQILYQATASECQKFLSDLAEKYDQVPRLIQLSNRFWSQRRPEGEKPPRPFVEEMFVACPATVVEKQRTKTIEAYNLNWLAVTGRYPMITGIDKDDHHSPTPSQVKHTRITATRRC